MECDRSNLQGCSGRPEVMWRELSILLCLMWTGCGLVYENRYDTEHITSYSNRNMNYLEEQAEKSERIYQIYEVLFGFDPGDLTILFHGEDGEKDVPTEVLGYYLKPFEIVKIFTTSLAPWDPEGKLTQDEADEQEEKLLNTVLQHEIAHHFVLSRYPDLAKRSWLNEGLAGTVEEGVIEEEKASFSLGNPSLIKAAKAAKVGGYNILDVVGMSWGEFHDDENKDGDYAAGYVICYYILTQWLPDSMRFDHKIDILQGIPEEIIISLDDEINAFLDKLEIVEVKEVE